MPLLRNINALILKDELISELNEDAVGQIIFTLGNISVTINTTDIVGNSLQSWLKGFLLINNIYFREQPNTQLFPDFFLSDSDTENLLEVKSFNYNANPAFDIANFESYIDSVKDNPYRLNADYLILGYTMDINGEITVKEVWLKKIWELCGSSRRFPITVQAKRNVIYNIRPKSNFRYNIGSFNSESEFILALYLTLKQYRGDHVATSWIHEFIDNYRTHFGRDFRFDDFNL